MKGGDIVNKSDKIEIIQEGTDNVNEMSALTCCWPPGTMNMEMPEPSE